jgi:hypothetical protein
VEGAAPRLFGPEHLETLADRAIGKQRTQSKDGSDAGWITGADILDTDFDLAKSVVSDSLHFALRVDSQKLPADLLRAYARAELKALAAGNPSGHPSARQNQEARDSARERLEAQAADGRFTRRRAYPVLWDAQAGQVLVGTTSANALGRVQEQFRATFGGDLTLIDAGERAASAEVKGRRGRGLRDVRPAVFLPAAGPAEVAWVKDPTSHNYLGNEFLLWLWFVLECDGDTLKLGDGSEVTAMLDRSLVLEDPRALSGSESIRSDAPVKLPEARRAVQAGKLPRRAGLTLVRHDQQYELTLQAELLGVSGAKLPVSEEREERPRLEERVGQVRHLVETLDLLYAAFLRRRLGDEWAKELERLQRWLQRDEKGRRQATA